MDKKYELTAETRDLQKKPAYRSYRIRALKDFGDVHAGDLGGYIHSEENLSQDGDCWVYDEAEVNERAFMSGDAKIHDRAYVTGNAHVAGQAELSGHALGGSAVVEGHAKVGTHARYCIDIYDILNFILLFIQFHVII